eukprot:TRINITY_DN22829_c0_g1_i1.p1 TRINITY_DN22829_c0_g1~~TRINITY_DN22829_c0_g1_i1.p1  ORF type:complete len:347 (+),score=69.88 TRINITY_DN22829_c0_g1_i1:115-1155(+)
MPRGLRSLLDTLHHAMLPHHSAPETSFALTYTTETNENISLSDKDKDSCIESCKDSPEMKKAIATESVGIMDAKQSMGQEEVDDCIKYCEEQFKSCFAGDAKVLVRHRGSVPLSQLRLGDEVLSLASPQALIAESPGRLGGDDGARGARGGSGPLLRFSRVLAWLHRDADSDAEMLRIRHALGHIQLTPDHVLFAQQGSRAFGAAFARDVEVGDRLACSWIDGGLAFPEVLSVETVLGKGLFAPLLESGTVLVDGTAASCYAIPRCFTRRPLVQKLLARGGGDALHGFAHALLYPLRASAAMSMLVTQDVDASRSSQQATSLDLCKSTIHPYCRVLSALTAAVLPV